MQASVKKSVRKLTEIQWEKLTGIVFLYMFIMCLTFPYGNSKKINKPEGLTKEFHYEKNFPGIGNAYGFWPVLCIM